MGQNEGGSTQERSSSVLLVGILGAQWDIGAVIFSAIICVYITIYSGAKNMLYIYNISPKVLFC